MDKKYLSILIGSLFVVAVVLILTNPFSATAGYPYVLTGQKVVTTPGVPVQFSSLVIPKDREIIVKAMATNTDVVAIGYSAATAVSTGTDSFHLYPGESIGLNISNANLLWLDAAVAGGGIEYITEFTY